MRSIPVRKSLSPLEQSFMDYVWTHPACTAEMCREGTARHRAFKESTVRTILKNLEKKGYAHPRSPRANLFLPCRRYEA